MGEDAVSLTTNGVAPASRDPFAIMQMLEQLLACESLDELSRTVLDAAVGRLGIREPALFLVEDGELRRLGVPDFPASILAEADDDLRQIRGALHAPPTGDLLRLGVRDVLGEVHDADVVAFPLLAGNEPVGVLCGLPPSVGVRETDRWRGFVAACCGVLGHVFHKQHAQSIADARGAVVREVAEMALSANQPFHDKMQSLLAVGKRWFGFSHAALLDWSGRPAALQVAVSASSDPTYAEGARVAPRVTFCAEAACSSEALFIRDAANGPYRHHPAYDCAGWQSCLACRVTVEGRTEAVLAFFGHESARELALEDFDLLTLMAHLAGGELEKTHRLDAAFIGQDSETPPGGEELDLALPPVTPRGRILIVEDNDVNQRIACCILTKAGHICETASDGEAALEMLERMTFDVILMDCQMPVLDGYQTARLIRERENGSGRRIAIVALTAHSLPGEHQRCLDAGMDDYVPKPVEPGRLLDAVRRNMRFLAHPV